MGTFQIFRKYMSYRILKDVGKLLVLNPGTYYFQKTFLENTLITEYWQMLQTYWC